MKTLYFISLVLVLLSCNYNDDSAEPNEYAAKFVTELNSSDTFLHELPLDFSRLENTVDSFAYNSLLKTQRILGLKSLENGTDSIQIRVSYGCALMSDWLMIILNHNRKKWTAEVSWVNQHFNIKKEVVDSLSRKIRVDRPKSGWVEFINKLFDLKILSIDHETVIPMKEYTSPNDGCRITFEITTKNAYRFYVYRNPDLQSKKFWQVANIIAIKELLYNEFAVLKKWDQEIEEDFNKAIEKNMEKIKGDQKNQKNGKVEVDEMTIQDFSDTTIIK